ncbi:MAG: lipid-A-disaccharide synthase [Tardiphaga sp.]|nr:lipid-A-disaccharide synthase [Tardiphaga sp.]
MREPAFWYRRSSWLARLLMPFGAIYGELTAMRMRKAGLAPGVPVICVGNYHVGGAGKTPTTLALVALLRDLGETPVVLSRGYGGRLQGPVSVDVARHHAADVGDEPLMMARDVAVVIARDRIAGAALARSRNASVIVMDDGFQNPSLTKDLALIVVDGDRGLGNGQIFPAGPLRAPLDGQIAATDALLIIGDGGAADRIAARITARAKPVLRGRILPVTASVEALRNQRVLAFCGIGDPRRFFRTLRAAGIDVATERAFADHHVFTLAEIAALRDQAARDGLTLVTTRKDRARLGAQAQNIASFEVTLAFDDPEALKLLVMERLNQARATAFRR